MEIKEAQAAVDHWIKTVGVRYYNELTNTAILMEEVGELARLMARIYGEQSFKRAEDEANAQENLGSEMGDILFVLLCLANQTGVDLGQALEDIMEKRKIRDAERHANNPKLKS
ncbi:nucleotide pyrophosphohydrolase [Saprospira grandis]|uniref:Putative pyrophosphatase n=1 Tax=Saprospira grandis DSM 2844 TaxID=694433 RepID=J1I3G7_9BACT|nr:nucleotide pyrophosphohydrolase [Saprospira grandis]EJF52868.1 putative pyrophosphatase [Saprospira grandis DSM 2844]WBM73306.1 nucleotide pyrophosphohydrolase [Saprospira grandis]